jgi:hypothetical protein
MTRSGSVRRRAACSNSVNWDGVEHSIQRVGPVYLHQLAQVGSRLRGVGA